jgi:hypothetical protein
MGDFDNFYVYLLMDPICNLPFYVGKGSKNRAYDHFNPKKSSKRVRKKIKNLYDVGVVPNVLFFKTNLNENEAYQLEKDLIIKYGRRGIDKNGILENICPDNRPPNCIGRKHSEETKKKMSKNNKGKNKGKIPWNLGKTYKFKRGKQTMQQTNKIMQKRIINLLIKMFEHYEEVDDKVIEECRKKNIISYNSPISQKAIKQYFGKEIKNSSDILQYNCA